MDPEWLFSPDANNSQTIRIFKGKQSMFYNEQGKHRRTKKEVLDEQGNLRAGCSIIPKGEI